MRAYSTIRSLLVTDIGDPDGSAAQRTRHFAVELRGENGRNIIPRHVGPMDPFGRWPKWARGLLCPNTCSVKADCLVWHHVWRVSGRNLPRI